MTDRSLFCMLLALGTLTARHASAQAAPDAQQQLTVARQLGADGIAAYLANDFTVADQKLERAYKMVAAPTLAFWSARARMRLGRWAEAIERYREAARLPDAVGDKTTQADARRDAQHELTELQARMPSVQVQLSGAAPKETLVSIDGKVVTQDSVIGHAFPIDPGDHTIVVQRGKDRQERSLHAAEREQKQVSIAFEPEKPAQVTLPSNATNVAAPTTPAFDAEVAESKPIRWDIVGIAGLSVGGAALLTSGIAWLVADSRRDKCPSDMCDTLSQLSSYNAARTVSLVSFYAGAALALGGAATWMLATYEPEGKQAHVSLNVAPTGVTVHGSF